MGILLKSAFGKRDTKNLFLLLGKKFFLEDLLKYIPMQYVTYYSLNEATIALLNLTFNATAMLM